MVKQILKEAEDKMHKALEVVRQELMKIRTGKATTALLDGIKVDYYGTPTPLNQVASLSIPESRQILISPWDAGVIGAIEKAIQKSELSVNPNNDGKVIRLVFPRLSEERRNDLIKQVHKRLEEARVSIRNVRRDVLQELKEMLKEKLISEDVERKAHDEVQKLTDKYVELVDKVSQAKEQEILEI